VALRSSLPGRRRTFESADRYGRALAAVATTVRRTLEPRPSDRVWGDSRVVDLRRKSLALATVAREAALTAESAAVVVRSADLSPDTTYHAIVAAAYADLIAAQAEDPDRDRPVAVRISALAFGPLLHLGVGGELFVAHGQRIRAALGDERTCIAALCDGSAGYLPTVDAFAVGGYEPNASLHEAGEGERLADAMIDLGAQAPAA
jgi:hypothetical protein